MLSSEFLQSMWRPTPIRPWLLACLALAGRALAQPPETPSAAPPDESSAAPAAPAPFDIWEFRVLGSKLVPSRDIESAVYPLLGPQRTIDTVEQARKAIEALYRSRGYGTAFIDIPEQDVGEGVVRLKVTEGTVDKVRISGARYFSNGRIRAELPSLVPGAVPNLNDLQQDLAQLSRESRDRTITPILKAGSTPGTVEVDLKVKDQPPVHGSIEVNNRYSADTTPQRLNVSLSYDNLFQMYHSLSLQYQTAPADPSNFKVFAATYVLPVGSTGDMLAGYFVDNSSNVAALGTLSVIGRGKIYGLRYIIPSIKPGAFSQNLTLGVDFKDFLEDVNLTDGTGLTTPIKYLNWSLAYTANYRGTNDTASASLASNFGIRGLLNHASDFEAKRFEGRPNYFYLKGDLSDEHALWWGSSLRLRLAGQYSVEPLIDNEQFSLGGADSVRGYLESEELGDTGLFGSVELRSPGLKDAWKGRIQQLYALAFYDAGFVANVNPLPQEAYRTDLASWGVGFAFAGFWGFQGGLDFAWPRATGARSTVGADRVLFYFRWGF